MKRYLEKYPLLIWVMLLWIAASCERGPGEIRMGQQECDHCRMLVSERAFASQLITSQGRSYVFDAIECMAAFLDSEAAAGLDIHSLWVPDFLDPERWIPAESAWYLQSHQLRSPMTLNFSAYASEASVRSQKETFEGQVLRWPELQSIVRENWSGGGHHRHGH